MALANGFGFARRQADGTVIGIYPRKSQRGKIASRNANSVNHLRTRRL